MPTDFVNILLADDNEADCNVFKIAFEELKIKTIVHIVNDGVQLMNHLNSSDIILPDIIFLDLNMPHKNGWECLKEIRNSNKLKDISVAIYSGSTSEKDIEESFVRGANIYINKPANYITLLKILSEVISINLQYKNTGLNKTTFLLNI